MKPDETMSSFTGISTEYHLEFQVVDIIIYEEQSVKEFISQLYIEVEESVSTWNASSH